MAKCCICQNEYLDSRLGIHITKTHKMSLESYYLKYLGPRGYCLTCGNPTNFNNIKSGYFRFCSNRCVGLNKDIQEKKKCTTKEHFGVEWPTQSKECQKKKVETLQEKYNCSNSFNITHIQEKAQKNSHTPEANIKRGQSIHNTKSILMQDNQYVSDIIEKAKSTNIEKYGVDWPSQLDSQKQQISSSVKNAYKNDETLRSRIRYKYTYNDIKFDSSYELALYIYAIDHNELIDRSPCQFSYISNGKLKKYTPDFLYKEEYLEIKGPQFFNNENEIYNPYNGKIDKDKYQCMLDNNVQILTYTDIKPYLIYCIDKFKDKHWYRRFKNHVN